MFFDSPAHPEQSGHDAAVVGEFDYRLFGERWLFSSKLFGLRDSSDPRRSAVDLREGYLLVPFEHWELKAGVDRVFWGVTESVHLVDIVNQTDLVANPAGTVKLGQPMLQLRWLRRGGSLDAFLLPYFRERPFPGASGRLRPGIPIAHGGALYESSAGRRHVDVAARYWLQAGRWDLGFSYFAGTNRDPVLLPQLDLDGRVRLQSYYSQISQFGLDAQHTVNAWLWKLELRYRRGELNRLLEAETYTAVAAGFEYTWFSVGGLADVGLVAEGLGDERRARTPHDFDQAAFVGMRVSLVDAASSQLLLGITYGLRTEATLARLEIERRLGHRWTVQINGFGVLAAPEKTALYDIRRDSHLQVRLVCWF